MAVPKSACRELSERRECTVGRIVVTQYLSLDGVMEAPGPRDVEDFKYKAWVSDFDRGREGDQFKREEMLDAEALLFGRVTYETFAAVWPGMAGAPGLAGEMADKFNAMPKYVISSTLTESTWANSNILRGNVVDEVGRLRREVRGDILVHGSRRLVQAMVKDDLVDELRQMIYPVILGAGRKMFGETNERKPMELVTAEAVGDGVLIVVHRLRDRRQAD
jgi:dihydrofolate reductase